MSRGWLVSPTEAMASWPKVPTIMVSIMETRLTKKASTIDGQATFARLLTVSFAGGRSPNT